MFKTLRKRNVILVVSGVFLLLVGIIITLANKIKILKKEEKPLEETEKNNNPILSNDAVSSQQIIVTEQYQVVNFSSGDAIPDNSFGNENDYFLNILTGDLYQKKNNNWV